MALIVKHKRDGSKKRRIIVDLRRSGANSRSLCPERIVLPRPSEITADARKLAEAEPRAREWAVQQGLDMAGWDLEVLSADFSDAYIYWAIREEDLRHCYAAHPDNDKAILWVALCFGLKAAPLLWGRLAAAVARMIQSLFHEDTVRSQVYLDDPMWHAVGPAWWRRRAFALITLTIRTLGLKIAWKKYERGQQLTWVGVDFNFAWAAKSLVMSIPPDRVLELVTEAADILATSMVGVKRLRSFAGRLSWVAGVVTRLQWAVAAVYALVYQATLDAEDGTEERRQAQRKDTRSKQGLVATKRCTWALRWIQLAMEDLARCPSRSSNLVTESPRWAIVADARPL